MELLTTDSPLSSFYSGVRNSRIPSNISMLRSIHRNPPSSVQGTYEMTALEDIVTALERARLPGPAILIGIKQYLGCGAQFIVHKQGIVVSQVDNFFDSDIAVKQPKFNLDPDKALRLTDKDAQQHLRNIVLEVEVLTYPELRHHPNIVRLLYWSYDHASTHLPITLVMELAICDLKKLLADEPGTSSSQRYQLCADVAAGLDAIHDCDLVHGDLKSENVLIFREQGRLVAKIADFGLSMGGIAGTGQRVKLGGTLGWQAPEVERGQALLPQELMKADSYSLGLLCWSAVLGSGSPPPRLPDQARTSLLARDLEDASDGLDERLLTALEYTLHSLLVEDQEMRPKLLYQLFNTTGTIEDDVSSTSDDPEQYYPEPDYTAGGFEEISDPVSLFTWEVPSLPRYFMESLCGRLISCSDGYPAEIISALFLFLTHGRFHKKPQTSALDVLLHAALQGCKPLYEIVPSAFEFYGREPPNEIKLRTLGWLEEAVSIGSVLGKRFLHSISTASFTSSLQRFRDSGGYRKYYCTRTNESQLHWLASYGSLEQLKSFLKSATNVGIEDRTGDGETPLYLACARGSWEIADELLEAGANANVGCTEFGITCLHWLFAFDESLQSIAARRLVDCGANPNAVLGQEVSFPQYPFLLPAGSPLHWAVVTASHTAIVALLNSGANVQIRDGSDPYRYDARFRYLDKFSRPNQDPFSIAEGSTQGLSPLDYSIMEYDPFLVEYLVRSETTVDINAVDEEGVSVLHRLSASHIRHTRASTTYSFLPFRGSRAFLEEQQKRIVSAIMSLGGELDKLSKPGAMRNQRAQRPALDSYTPLMLAAKGGCCSVVKVLLTAGASSNFTNPMGNTVLLCLPDDDGTACQIISHLISAGAEIHTRGRGGNTALIRAAAYRNISSVDLLLSHGADVENTDVNKNSVHQGWSVFDFLARSEDPFDESHDLQVAQLLEKYVFRDSEGEKGQWIIHHRSHDGETLLHRFASCAMRQCVRVMLQNGAPPNAPTSESSSQWERDKNTRVRLSWEETPLDAVKEFWERTEQRMERNSAFSTPEYENLLERVKAVAKDLEDAGGRYLYRS